jgi:hypothetical protein
LLYNSFCFYFWTFSIVLCDLLLFRLNYCFSICFLVSKFVLLLTFLTWNPYLCFNSLKIYIVILVACHGKTDINMCIGSVYNLDHLEHVIFHISPKNTVLCMVSQLLNVF